MNVSYKIEIGESELDLRLDVFNLFNANNATRYNENAEKSVGDSNPQFGYAAARQSSRSMEITVDYKF